jgi:hypothetical protein
MKTKLIVLLIVLSATQTFAQEYRFASGREKQAGKSELFTKVSARASAKTTQIEELMSYKLNQSVNVVLSNGVEFNGTVTAITNDAPGLETIIIQSINVEGLVLSVSKIQMADQPVQYRGVLMSTHHRDMVLLERDGITGKYVWNKTNVSNLIAD